MSAHMSTSESFASVVAFYGEPLPHELGNKGYMSVICEARIAALRTMMGETAISYRAPVSAVVLAAAAAVTAPRKTRVKKAATLAAVDDVASGLAFEHLLVTAKQCAMEAYGNRWDIAPEASQWVSIPTKLAHYKFKRGDGSISMTIRNRRDFRAPAPHCWPSGTLPGGVTVIERTNGSSLQRANADRMRAQMAYRPDFLNVALCQSRIDGVKTDARCDLIRQMWQARRTLLAAEARVRTIIARS